MRKKKYNPNIRAILSRSANICIAARKKYLINGSFGQLIDTSLDTARFVVDPLAFLHIDGGLIEVYNVEQQQWEQVLVDDVPRTYSFLPKPKDKNSELEYFVRMSCLVGHTIVWSRKQIPKDVFARVASNTNRTNRGKFTIAPWLESVHNIPKISQHGFLEFEM